MLYETRRNQPEKFTMTVTRRAFSASLCAAALSVAGPAGVPAANSMHWVQCVAIEKGYYKELGFDAQAAVIQNSPHSIQMAITGRFQIATSQPEPFVAAVQRGAQAIQRAHTWLWDPGNKTEAIKILAKYTKRADAILDRVYQEYFVTDKIYGRKGEIELAGLQRALDDMAQDGEVFKTAPPARKFVLDPSLGAILA
jgi:hypothetical protein